MDNFNENYDLVVENRIENEKSGIREMPDIEEARRRLYEFVINVSDEACDCKIPAFTVMARYETHLGETEYIETTRPIVFRINRRYEGATRPEDYNRDNRRLATYNGRTYHIQAK